MNRRDFLRMAGFGALGSLLPGCVKRLGDEMPIGETLKKLAEGLNATSPGTMSAQEIEELRLWGNQTQLLNAFTTGTQTGVSNVRAGQVNTGSIVAREGDFLIQPNNASWFGCDSFAAPENAQLIPKTTLTPLASAFAYSVYHSGSMVVPYDLSTGKFMIGSSFTRSGVFIDDPSRVMMTAGSVEVNYTGVANVSFHQRWYYKSDDSLFETGQPMASGKTPEQKNYKLNFPMLFQPGEELNDLYFQILAYHDASIDLNMYPLIGFYRLL